MDNSTTLIDIDSNISVIIKQGQNIWISDQVCRIYEIVVIVVICQIIAIFGTVGNTINLICFVKQGFQDSVNVNFFGLAVSDIGCLVTQVCASFAYNPLIQDLDKPFDVKEFVYIIIGWPHVLFARLTGLITAIITVERCFCILVPLKVKSILTPKRAGLTIAGMFAGIVISVSPIYFVNRIVWIDSHEKNKTLLVLTFTPDRAKVEAVCSAIINGIVPFVAFLIISVCTCVLVLSLRNKSRWRETSVALDKAQDLGKREQKVVKMVVTISTLFIISYFPICVICYSMMLLPELAIDGKDLNVSIIVCGIGLLLEAINSSLNIFIYYNMSSRYKLVFRQMFGLSQQPLS